MATTSFMFSVLECLFSYGMMAALCRSIAKRNPSEDLSGIDHVKYSYAFGLVIIFSLEFLVICLQLEVPAINKMWEYASGIALIPSCLMSILEAHKDPENKAVRNMRSILCGIIIFIITCTVITMQMIKGGNTAELQKTIVETLGKDNPDFKAALEKTLKDGIDPDKLNLTKEIQDSFTDLLKDAS